MHPRIRWRSMALLLMVALPAAAADPTTPGIGIHYVYLIRHGDYDRDPDRNADDVVSNGINALGHEQASLVGARLATLPIKPAALVSSTYRRAQETAEDIGRKLGMTPTLDSLLHECTAGSERADYMKNHSVEEIAACDSNLAQAWRKYLVPSPDADRHDILVCHGNVIRWFVSRAVSGDPRHWPAMEIANGSLTILAVRPDGSVRLVSFSDVGHLPVAKQTWTGKGAGWSVPAKR
jgi:serine/threonine-protein phosphatase PGAM5